MSTTLVLGGLGSGRSQYAQQLFHGRDNVVYVATEPDASSGDGAAAPDSIDAADRPAGWRTAQTHDIPRAILNARGPVLVNSLGGWVTRLIDDIAGWEDPVRAHEHVDKHLDEMLVVWRWVGFDMVAVGEEVGMSAPPDSAPARLYQEAVGRVNAAVGAASEHVVLTIAGRAVDLSSYPRVG